MRSRTLPTFTEWLATASDDNKSFVDKVYYLAEKLAKWGGDEIFELYAPVDVLREFGSLDDVRRRIGFLRLPY